MRSVLDGIASRLDEQREVSRYMIGLLIFLGLLGTFWGLLLTIGSISDVIGNMSVGSGDLNQLFNQLKAGLAQPLRGMGTAFSASMLGLAGALVLGFLDLSAGQAQTRFFNELEEWLAGITRLSSGVLGSEGEGGGGVPAYVQALLEQTAENLEALQRTLERGRGRARRGRPRPQHPHRAAGRAGGPDAGRAELDAARGGAAVGARPGLAALGGRAGLRRARRAEPEPPPQHGDLHGPAAGRGGAGPRPVHGRDPQRDQGAGAHHRRHRRRSAAVGRAWRWRAGGGRTGGGLEAWPGYVDALSTLLMVIIFVLLVFALAQGFLSVACPPRTRRWTG
jgi:hypothetical protein